MSSSQHGYLKPHPSIFQAALQLLGVPAGEAMMVGDSAADVGCARGAGCRVILVGFGYSSVPVSSLGADGVIDRLSDVRAYLGLQSPGVPQWDSA